MTGLTRLTNAPVSRHAVAKYLEDRITSGGYEPGARLPSERQLAEELHVSRPIVREALRALVERRLIEVLPGRGAFVSTDGSVAAANSLDSLYRFENATARDLIEAREMLECTAAELASERASEQDLAGLEAAVTGCEEAHMILDEARFDLAFHLGIARAAKNPVIETMFRSISGLTIELMFRSLSDPAVTSTSIPIHREVLEAIRHRDSATAREAMSRHLALASQLYGEDYEASIKSVAQRELARLFEPGVTLEELLDEVNV
jgi:GntR family transcriptional repressor for pyruvate dehydrogenase complex